MASFKKGDLVKLKSGGPTMTVDACPGDESGHAKCTIFGLKKITWSDYCCRWYDGKEYVYEQFGGHLLKSVDE